MQGKFSRRNWLIVLLFGTIGQIAWSVENMYFNLFVFETISPNLDTVTLMVQLSGITATVVTLLAGTFSDKTGNRRSFIAIGYIIWGVTVALFGFIETELFIKVFNLPEVKAVAVALTVVVVGDCVMTVFGSTANDAAFNAWVTDNTTESNRGRVEGVLAILPLVAMLIVAGGFGILVELIKLASLIITMTKSVACGNRVQSIFDIQSSQEVIDCENDGDNKYKDKWRNNCLDIAVFGNGQIGQTGLTVRPKVYIACGNTEEFLRPQLHPMQYTDYSPCALAAFQSR